MYNEAMRSDLELKIFRSPAEAREDELNHYRALTPEERVDILIELIYRHGNQTEHRLDRTPTVIHGQ
jgi:hypothetical protein